MRIAIFAVVAAVACSTGRDQMPSGPLPTDTTRPVPALVRVAGDSQVGTVGTTLPTPLEVAVSDTAGRGVAGVLVQFAVVGTSARLTPGSGIVRSGDDGHARVTVTLGRRAEAVRVVAASAGASGVAAFDLSARPSSAVTVVPISGDSQVVALPGSGLDAFVVAVRDTFGNAVGVRSVTFRVTGGSATFSGASEVTVTSDLAGVASATLTTPAPAEGDTVRVTASTPGAVTSSLQLAATGLAYRGLTWDAGHQHVCMIAATGQAYCWGANTDGRLGDGGTANQALPVPVVGGAGFLSVSAGWRASCGLMAEGPAACWGNPSYGVPNGGAVPYRSISAGYDAGCGVSGTGTVSCGSSALSVIAGPVRFVEVSVGNAVACGLTAAGRAWCWGDNRSGQLGAGDRDAGSSPRPVAGGLTFISLSAGSRHACGVTADGTGYCWGGNESGQLGTGDTVSASAPVPVTGGLAFRAISVGSQHTCALTMAGAAYCWGRGDPGQLGNGTTWVSEGRAPTPVSGGITFASIGAGGYFSCGVAVGGAAYCWGENSSGQLGNGTTSSSTVPVAVVGGLLFRP